MRRSWTTLSLMTLLNLAPEATPFIHHFSAGRFSSGSHHHHYRPPTPPTHPQSLSTRPRSPPRSDAYIDVIRRSSSRDGRGEETVRDMDAQVSALRRKVYEALLPLDRGDFRWEFLVPESWRDGKDLTRTDKIIVCSTFIGIAICLQEVFDARASVGVHLSYIAQFFSYAIGNPIGFRIIAIVSSLLEVVGDLLESAAEKEDAIPVLYNVLFIPINSYYVMRWLLNREAVVFTPDEEALYTSCFAPLGFARGQFSRLLREASFERAGEGEMVTLCTEGEPLKELFVAVNGTVDVMMNGVVAARIPPYQVIGEASLLENLQSEGGTFHQPARATIVAEPGAAFVRWSQRSFFKLQASDPEIAYTIQLMIARTLSSKLRSARLSQQITVNQKGGQSQPMLDAPLRSPEEQKLYATCFEGLGVTQDQFTRILSLATFEAATSLRCCGGGVNVVEAGESWSRIIIPTAGTVEANFQGIGCAYPAFNAIETATSLAAIEATMPDGDEAKQAFLERKEGVSSPASSFTSSSSSSSLASASPSASVEAAAACTAETRAPARRVKGRRELVVDRYIEEEQQERGQGGQGAGDVDEDDAERPKWVFPQAPYDVVALEGSRWVTWTVTDLVSLMLADPELERLVPLLLVAAFDPDRDEEFAARLAAEPDKDKDEEEEEEEEEDNDEEEDDNDDPQQDSPRRPRRGPDGYIDLSDLDIGLI